ncbi:MAG: prepilin-type N-terminal cleavage/methylation domain-containing protein [Thermomicrobiales bacterium]|nr:prepilin-type N-terminal cleavage/methylation domain-containing protein [Thermomicrobiales bacterium]
MTAGRFEFAVIDPRRSRGFSLIELVMVVVIMGIVASVAVARFGNFAYRAKVAAAREAVRSIQATVDEEESATGQWPTVLTSVMFVGERMPTNPFLPTQGTVIEVADAVADNPGNMEASTLSDGAFWYNKSRGVVRARVSPQGTTAATLALYNLINGTSEVALGSDVGGGSGGATVEPGDLGGSGGGGKLGGKSVELIPVEPE